LIKLELASNPCLKRKPKNSTAFSRLAVRIPHVFKLVSTVYTKVIL